MFRKPSFLEQPVEKEEHRETLHFWLRSCQYRATES